jgi:hypothetical protein
MHVSPFAQSASVSQSSTPLVHVFVHVAVAPPFDCVAQHTSLAAQDDGPVQSTVTPVHCPVATHAEPCCVRQHSSVDEHVSVPQLPGGVVDPSGFPGTPLGGVASPGAVLASSPGVPFPFPAPVPVPPASSSMSPRVAPPHPTEIKRQVSSTLRLCIFRLHASFRSR